MSLVPEVTTGNVLAALVGPVLSIAGIMLTNAWQQRQAEARNLTNIISPLKEAIDKFVPKSEIDVRFLAVEGRQMQMMLSVDDVLKRVQGLEIKQGQTDEGMRTHREDISEIKQTQKDMLRRLDQIMIAVTHDHK